MYYQAPGTSSPAAPSSLWKWRLLLTAPLFLFPIGGLALLAVGDPPGLLWLSVSLVSMLLCLFSLGLIAPSYFQYITKSQTEKLDEMEQALRLQATSRAYHSMGLIVWFSLFYLIVAGLLNDADQTGLWIPSTVDNWVTLFLGAILFYFLLPSVWLAWIMTPPPSEED